MAVAIISTDFAEPAGPDMYDAVGKEMDVENDPPQGLIFHWAGHLDGKWTISDVWESREDHTRFLQERLFPAIQKASGMNPADGPQPTITECPIHNYMKV